MDKSITSRDYRIFLRELRAARERSGVTQVALAAQLGETQSFISKCERGERRLDIVELRTFCHAIGTPLPVFVQRLDRLLNTQSAMRKSSSPRKRTGSPSSATGLPKT